MLTGKTWHLANKVAGTSSLTGRLNPDFILLVLASPDRICYYNGHTAFSPATTDIALTDPKADPFPEYGFGEEDGASFRIGLPQNP